MKLRSMMASVVCAAAIIGTTPAVSMTNVFAADTADQLLAGTTVKKTATKVTVKVTKTKMTKTVYTFQKVTLKLTGAKGFKSSNKKIATVTKKGVVSFKKAGTVKITFKKGKKTYTVTLKVKKPVLTLSKSKLTVKVKKTATVKAKKVTPVNPVKWSVKNKKIATVKNGKIKGVKKGTTYVYAKANGVTAKVKVTVKK